MGKNNILDLKLNYKVRASIILNKQISFVDKGLSWLYAENEKTFIKTVEKNQTTNMFHFSVKNNNKDLIQDILYTDNIYIGCVTKDGIECLKISNLKVQSENQTINLIINDQFKLAPSSHITCDIKRIHLNTDFNIWANYQSEQDRIDGLCTKQRIEDFKVKGINFKEWYKNEEKVCCYCGINQTDLEKYFHDNNEQYKEARQRGKYLEIERVSTIGKDSKEHYYPENTRLACYICNNAKSDFLSAKAFKSITKGIYLFWKDEVKIDNITFPENSDIWNKKAEITFEN